jgi:hypothetical protein
VSLDDDIHVIEKVKGCFSPCFYCKQTNHPSNRMQIIMPTTNNGILEDRNPACQCMTLPVAQYYLQARFGLACAMLSA